jgi:hypothetical protein
MQDLYNLGAQAGLEKIGVSDAAVTAATGFLSPTLSGLTAEEGKGLQTSLAGIAGNLIGKKLLRSDLAGRLLGSGAATAASKVGAGLVSPDPEEIRQMKRRGEFSWWDYGTRAANIAGRSAAIGAGIPLVLGAGVPAAALGAASGLGRGAFGGLVISPMIGQTIKGVQAMRKGDEAYKDKSSKQEYYNFRKREPYYQIAGATAANPQVQKAIAEAVTGDGKNE